MIVSPLLARSRLARLGLLAALTLGCGDGGKTTPTKVERLEDGPPGKPERPKPTVATLPEPPQPPVEVPEGLVLGPARDTHGTGREDAVLTLLGDGLLAGRLPVVASDPGVEFDPRLVERLAPGAQRSSVRALKPEVVGDGFDRAVVHRVVRGHYVQLRNCYDASLLELTNEKVALTLELEIAADGTISEARAQTQAQDDGLTQCIVDAAKSWRFPAPRDAKAAAVRVPLEFRPS